ncbi:MAG: hypothetical protein IJB82_00165 [Bacilli bacterium]|nr:hypothetical protein [Bacilli bacterium]
MAKKKVKKEESKKNFQYTKELEGLILVLVGIIGVGNFGIVGKIIKGFSVFLLGNWYIIFLIICLILGLSLILTRKNPNYFTARLIGFYTVLSAILLYSHIGYLENTELKGVEILRTTIDNIMLAVENLDLLRDTGGGLVGAIFSLIFVTLFDITGTKIVVIVLLLFGLVMIFDVTLIDMFKWIIKLFKRKEKKETVKIEGISEDDDNIDEEEKEDKIIITSVDELKEKESTLKESIEEFKDETNDIIKENFIYTLPPLSVLDAPKKKGKVNSTEYITANTKVLERVFNDFNIKGKVVKVHVGPTVTQYEIEVSHGTKLNKILSINREIALALAAKDVRIQAPIPGKSTVGVELPNPVSAEVKMREILEEIPSKLSSSKLLAPLGRDIMGNVQYVEINKTPHMLIAGSTGSGKSVCINNIITSILMRAKPDEVKLVLVDPKKVELNVYEGIPHLLRPVVTNPKQASVALQKICVEMEKRYDMFKDSETKNIQTYNDYVDKINAKKPGSLERMPFILVIIDELADLMLVAAKEVEESIMRITQLARAAGIHLIVATQRPSTDVITGLIKSNIPSRVSFAVASSIDSRTILDMTGAEKLLGKGDMLFLPMGENSPIRIQGSYISDDEIKRVVDAVKKNGKAPNFDERFVDLNTMADTSNEIKGSEINEEDPLYNDILEFAIKTGKISASLIQRKYHLGYNRAARIIDIFEEKGIVGSQNGSKPREVLVKLENKEE